LKEVIDMPIGGRVSASPVSGKDVRNARCWFFIGWVLVIGVLPWIFWWNPGGKPEFQFQVFSICGLLTLAFLSPFAGWFFGYKLLFAPLFVARILINE
jgi:hypothetical protein